MSRYASGAVIGHWRKRGSGIELRVFVGRDPLSGRKRHATRTIPMLGRRDADRALAAFAAEVAERPPNLDRSRTFGELLDRWFEAVSGDWSPGTAYNTRWIIDHRLAGLRDRPLRAIDTATLDQFYAALRARGGRNGAPLSAASVQRTHGVVRLALRQAVRWGWRSDNPAERASPGRVRKAAITPPTAAEVARLLDAAEEQDVELLTFLFLDAETGARRGELSALRLTDFGDASVRIARRSPSAC